MTDAPRNNSKRRFLQFSLRSLLLGMLLVSVVLGWKVDRARKQRAAVQWVRRHGGSVTYEHEKTDAAGYPLPSEPPGPEWLRDALGIDFLDNVCSVYLSGAQVSDLAPLADLKGLKKLDLAGTQVADLAPLAG